MHAHAPCMYAVCVLYASILCVYSIHVFYACILYRALSRPAGAFWPMFRKLRIQGRVQIFEKMSQKALNRVLTLAKDSRGRELSKSSGIIDLPNV